MLAQLRIMDQIFLVLRVVKNCGAADPPEILGKIDFIILRLRAGSEQKNQQQTTDILHIFFLVGRNRSEKNFDKDRNAAKKDYGER